MDQHVWVHWGKIEAPNSPQSLGLLNAPRITSGDGADLRYLKEQVTRRPNHV